MKQHVLVLNADYSPMNHVSIEHAFRMIVRGVAVFEEFHPIEKFNREPRPTKLRLLRYVQMSWFYAKPVLWSKSGIMLRDRKTCAYCLGNADTIDHIHPVSKGGKSTWLNCVASCKKCNQKKNNRSLAEIGWDLQIKPYVPTRVELAERKIEMTELKQLER